jgi:autophagy-related protein 9
MASHGLSRWRPQDNPSASIYETIRQQDRDEESDDADEEAQLYAFDREHDDGSITSTQPPLSPNQLRPVRMAGRFGRNVMPNSALRPKWMARGKKLHDVEDLEDDVPASLLIEGDQLGLGPGSISLPPPPSSTAGAATGPAPPMSPTPHVQQSVHQLAPLGSADPRAVAMWRWANVVNLDNFLHDVYDYYSQHGFWSILLRRFFTLITAAFIVGFTLFLTQCIDYHSSLHHIASLKDVMIRPTSRCIKRMGFFSKTMLWLLILAWLFKAFQYVLDIRRLRNLHDFYLYLLNVPDAEIQSISWQEIVSRLMALRDSNPTIALGTSKKTHKYATTQNKQRLDAVDIANRLMRQENYTIAMINKEILDMTLPIPFLRKRQLFTRTLEWNLNFCIMDFVFNDRGQLRQIFLKDTHRKELSEALRKRFLFAGWMNLIIAPFLIIFFLISNFFTYFNEYQKNPGAINSRTYSPLAEWKFREFNELYHLFLRRTNMSHPFADRYIDQFPKDKTIQAARFVTFVSGALISILALATLFDQENFLAMEITPGRTAIFYIGLFGGIWAVARGMIPEDNHVYEPAFAMQEVIDFTHYHPQHWKDRLHTVDVKREFEQLYQMKILLIVEEVLSMIFTPFVLWFSLPKCSDRIIDFFREFTVHVDGIGYVCSFAEFKFKRPAEGAGPSTPQTAPAAPGKAANDIRDDQYFATTDQKLEQSYWGFINDYARNPKADPRFHHHRNNTRKRVQPPPVPGLPSPSLHGAFEAQNPAFSMFSPPQKPGLPQGSSHIPTAHTSATSPLQSMLLDPHHQPVTDSTTAAEKATKSSTMLMSQTYPRGLRRGPDIPSEVLAEEDEDQDQQGETGGAGSSKGGDESASRFEGSWKYEDDEESESDEDDHTVLKQDGAGVLGLIKRLQKTQNDVGANL